MGVSEFMPLPDSLVSGDALAERRAEGGFESFPRSENRVQLPDTPHSVGILRADLQVVRLVPLVGLSIQQLGCVPYLHDIRPEASWFHRELVLQLDKESVEVFRITGKMFRVGGLGVRHLVLPFFSCRELPCDLPKHLLHSLGSLGPPDPCSPSLGVDQLIWFGITLRVVPKPASTLITLITIITATTGPSASSSSSSTASASPFPLISVIIPWVRRWVPSCP